MVDSAATFMFDIGLHSLDDAVNRKPVHAVFEKQFALHPSSPFASVYAATSDLAFVRVLLVYAVNSLADCV
jgi:hypothetical protein